MNAGFKLSGWYDIEPDGPEGALTPFSVYCDLSTGEESLLNLIIIGFEGVRFHTYRENQFDTIVLKNAAQHHFTLIRQLQAKIKLV